MVYGCSGAVTGQKIDFFGVKWGMVEELDLRDVKIEWARKGDSILTNWLADRIWLLRALVFEKPRLIEISTDE